MHMKKFIIIGIAILAVAMFLYYRAHPLVTQLEIRGNRFTVELAVTNTEKEKGLGYRDALAPDNGMLFLYDHAEQYGFWMKGMRFPIDIVWIKDNSIVDLSRNVPVAVSDELSHYSPKTPVNKVLELNAGTVDRLGIQVGDMVQILNN